MPTPKQGYYLADGTRVPGVTTIIGGVKCGGIEPLLHWSWETAHTPLMKARGLLENLTTALLDEDDPDLGAVLEFLDQPVEDFNYRTKRDKAADIGTLAHNMIERDILGHTVEIEGDPDMIQKAESAYGAYCEWADQSKLEIIATEMQLVSETHRFGGTPDAIGRLNGKIVLLDWKTSNSVYGDHLVQLAAYHILVEECTDYKIEGHHLCRFAKEHGDFAHHSYPDLTREAGVFLKMREIYEEWKAIRKRAA